jgi:thiopurine S-methyltransferase
MEHDFWFERWKNQQLGFHLDEANQHLVAHGRRLADQPTRVLVPLAGKSRDLTWLRALGHEVVGVEFVEQAGLAFFEESGLDPAAGRLGPHPVFRADGITMVLDDFFALDPAALGRFPAIYDRAALVAVDPARRREYVKLLRDLASDDARLLLVSFDHDIGTGPPFTLPESELRALMAGRFTLEQVADIDILPSEPRFRERGATRVREQVWFGRAVVPAL